MGSPQVTAVGDVNIDLVTSSIEGMPEKDSQVIMDSVEVCSGGCAGNFAKAISRLGSKARLIGCPGNDLFHEFLNKELSQVDFVKVDAENSKTGVTYALSFEDGSRSFLTYPGSNARLKAEKIKTEWIEGNYLHVASFFLQGLRMKTMDLLKKAHEKDMVTSFDTGWDPGGWSREDKKMVKEVLKEVDIFFPNLKEASALTGEKNEPRVCELLLEMGPEVIALKKGEEGSVICTKEEYLEIESKKVSVQDSTGAGDVYAAGFIHALNEGNSLRQAGELASRAAAFSTRRKGSKGYPTKEEIRRFFGD